MEPAARVARARVACRQTTVTIAPDTAPLQICPQCDRRLTYVRTVLSGVDPPDRWDQFSCLNCGPFEYRHRTRKLRQSLLSG